MRRILLVLFTLSPCHLVALSSARADAFDHYVNPVLSKLVESKNVTEIKQLTPNLIVDHDRVLPRTTSAFLVVRTNEGRYAKLLVQAARQKVGDKTVPILYIEQFVTYKEGQERTIQATGKNQSLYAGFRFSLDLGQVVPESLGGDLRFVADGDKVYTEPVGKAKLYLVTKHDPNVMPKKGPKFVMGERFEPRYFNGTYKLYDDGRRSGKLILKVAKDGSVSGAYYSDKDGQKYDLHGKIGDPQHAITFEVKFPRTEQLFKGMLFTGNGKAIAGTSRLAGRDWAFYAVREE
jgi:hypothetical protein